MTSTSKPSSRRKKALWNSWLYIALVVLVSAVAIFFFNSSALEYIYMYAELVNMETIQQSLNHEDPFSYDYYKHIDNISSNNYYLIEIFDSNGNTVCTNVSEFLYSSEVSGEIEKSYAVGEVIRSLKWIDSKASVDLYYYESDNIAYVRYRAPMDNNDTIRLWVPSFQIRRNASIAGDFLSFFTIITALIITIVLLAYNSRFTHPIAQLSDVAEAMTKLDFTKKCEAYPQTHVNDLAQSINSLSSSLSKTLDELNENNQKLKKELDHSAMIDESRKDFIANVSHELKTPIAIIKGYAEGLQLGISSDPQSVSEYCDIIISESDKMNKMVLDLLNLEKIESGSYKPLLEDLNLSEFIKRQLAAFAVLFDQNQIKIINDIPDNLLAHSDIKTLLIVCQNFLSNAVSNISEEKIVRLSYEDKGANHRIIVFNSGDPISENELEKIWYSFYKSNKKRKDESLHFGLGLPTVKAVQEKLGKDCGVYNTAEGPCFWFDVGK